MNLGLRICLFALAGLAIPALVAAEEPSRGEVLFRIDQTVEESMERDRVPGVSIAIEHEGELLVARGYGVADVENQVPATEHTVQ